MSDFFIFVRYIPEAIAIAILGYALMFCFALTAVCFGVLKVKSSNSSELWKSASPLPFALKKTGVCIRYLFLAYAAIFPFYRDYPNTLTVSFAVCIVATIFVYSLIWFRSVRSAALSGVPFSGKSQVRHNKQVAQIRNQTEACRSITGFLINRKNK